MDAEHQQQAQRLIQLRGEVGGQGAYGRRQAVSEDDYAQQDPHEQVTDPLIYPGLYAPSGMDLMSILMRVYSRPNPQIVLGNVDSAVALVVCDAEAPDFPTVYCSEPFEALTGYQPSDILGRNCRFLQHPSNGQLCADQDVNRFNAVALSEMRRKIHRREEVRARVVNFRKDGSRFMNAMTLIPISYQGDGERMRNYIVGFQADERSINR